MRRVGSRLVAPAGRFSLGTVGARETIVANNAAHNCLKLACISERGIHKVAVRIPGVIVPCGQIRNNPSELHETIFEELKKTNRNGEFSRAKHHRPCRLPFNGVAQ